VILFDGAVGTGQDWSDRDEAMARRLLAAAPAQARTLAVAGNAHTPTSPTELGIPMGAWLNRQRPGVREIRINYGSGRSYNSQPCRFAHHGLPPRQIRLRQQHGSLVLDLPTAQEAIVPQIREMSVKGTRSPCALHIFCDRSAQAEGYVVPESTRRAGAGCG